MAKKSNHLDTEASHDGRKSWAQKWVLQRKDSQGFFVRVATYDKPVSEEDVLEEFGGGYYVLRRCKPRFFTEWKKDLGPVADRDPTTDRSVQKEIRSLRRRTDLLAIGLGIAGVAELVGFPLAHHRFNNIEARLDQLTTAIQKEPAQNLQCPFCRSNLDFILQPFCSSCGGRMNWPRKGPLLPASASSIQCNSCGRPLLSHQAYCPDCGTYRLNQISFTPWLP